MAENLISVAEARQRFLQTITPVDAVQIRTREALNYVLAQPVDAALDLPYFNNSSMDGYAVRSIDTRNADQSNGISLEVVFEVAAGVMPRYTIESSQAARIMTGAPLPPGADAVVPVEFTNHSFLAQSLDQSARVEIFLPVKPGDYIRTQGEDIKRGERVMEPGNRLRPQDLGFLAMLGIHQVSVYRKPRIALLSTGDELISLGTALEPGKIYDANSYSLGGLIQQNFCELILLEPVQDEIDQIVKQLDHAVDQRVDMIITSGGVSVGAFDYVREVIRQFGKLDFWRINMRPGKPLAFGNYKGIPLVGLPGNPVSAYVGFEVVVRSGIIKMSGMTYTQRTSSKVILTEEIQSDGRESYLRAWVWEERGKLYAKLTTHQGSGNLHSLVLANAFLIVPSEVKSLPIDTELEAWIFSDYLYDSKTKINS